MCTLQQLIMKLNKYWESVGSVIMTPLDIEIGAGTFHPITFFNAIQGNTRIFISYIQ